MSRIIRVFARKTLACPSDDLVYFGYPPLIRPDADEVHVSCTFTYDKQWAEKLAAAWAPIYKTYLGGPAYDDPGDRFTPGMYLANGYNITSRGCIRHCWFCMAKRREGWIRELPIAYGHNILDNNLLACSKEHVANVFSMLKKCNEKPIFSGGIDSRLVDDWVASQFREIRTKRLYLAYDTADDREPLADAMSLIKKYIKPSWHVIQAYVLIGYPRDTFEKAEERLNYCIDLGIMPYAMLYRDETGHPPDLTWKRFQRTWLRPSIVGVKARDRAITARPLVLGWE